MKKLLLIIIFFLSLSAFAQSNKTSVPEFDNAYLNEIKAENTALTNRIKTLSKDAQELNTKIGQEIKNNENEKALQLAFELDKMVPNNADVKNFIGKRQAKALDFQKAISSFDEAIRLDPKNKWFYINKATIQAENKELDEALKTIETLINMYPNWSIGYNLKCSFLRELNQQSEALRTYELALMAEPKSAQIYTNRGDLYVELSKEKEAISDYKKALEIQPDYRRASEKLNYISQKK